MKYRHYLFLLVVEARFFVFLLFGSFFGCFCLRFFEESLTGAATDFAFAFCLVVLVEAFLFVEAPGVDLWPLIAFNDVMVCFKLSI